MSFLSRWSPSRLFLVFLCLPGLLGPHLSAQTSDEGMVVSQSVVASRVGAWALSEGGNAVDAAVATAFALAVTHPSAGNLGGGGFLVWRAPDGKATTYDFREKAPLAAHETMFLDEQGRYDPARHHGTHLSVGVPGTVAGLWKAHRRHGRLPWRSLVAPAVALARDGFLVSEELSRSLESQRSRFRAYPATMKAFFKEDGSAYRAGERLRQPDLSRTLHRIMMKGAAGFYAGETARLIADEMKRQGGLITEEDLSLYEAVERAPVIGRYRGRRIIGMGPPSSGGITLINMLNMLECFPVTREPQGRAHLLAEVMRRAYADRAAHLGDPDFNDLEDQLELIDKEHAKDVSTTIDLFRASRSRIEGFAWQKESDETTHFSVVDAELGAVALTYTLEFGYGSGIVVPGAGFLLNNEMGDFNPKRGLTDKRGRIGSPANLAAPQKRMLSSMSPTIVEDRRGRLHLVLGTPGGRTIINTVFQILTSVVDYGKSIDQAVAAGRLHHQWFPDRITIERRLLEGTLERDLKELGHELRVIESMGAAECLEVLHRRRGHLIRAGVDPRAPDGGAVYP